ncbi:MAG: transglutaminase-like domain-containing protein, partial [bacterium]
MIWFILLGWMMGGGRLVLGGGIKGPEDLIRGGHLPSQTIWMSIYMKERKIGFARSSIGPWGREGYLITEVSAVELGMMGVPQKMKLETNIWTDSLLALKKFDGKIQVPGYTTLFNGEHRQQSLIIRYTTTAGQPNEKVFPATEPIYLTEALRLVLQKGELNFGDTLKLSGFDPIKIGMQEVLVIGDDLKEHTLRGKKLKCRRLQVLTENIQTVLYVDAEGNNIAEFGPLGLEIWRSSEEEALRVEDGQGGWDFLDLFAVVPQGKIETPRKVQKMIVKIQGLDDAALVKASSRQEVKGDTVIVVREAPIIKEDPKILHQYGLPSPYIESDHQLIIDQAQSAVRGANDKVDSLKALSRWVFHYVHKYPSPGIPSALSVLKQRQGDCNEHSVLFVALARALGFPSRIHMGLVYHQGKFYYHAWPASWVSEENQSVEEYLDEVGEKVPNAVPGRWVEFDPTFGET